MEHRDITIAAGFQGFKAACDRERAREGAIPHLIIGVTRYNKCIGDLKRGWLLLVSRNGDAPTLVSAHRLYAEATAQLRFAKAWVQRSDWATDECYMELCEELAAHSDSELSQAIVQMREEINDLIEATPDVELGFGRVE